MQVVHICGLGGSSRLVLEAVYQVPQVFESLESRRSMVMELVLGPDVNPGARRREPVEEKTNKQPHFFKHAHSLSRPQINECQVRVRE